jgi:hypothetical protein
MRKCIIGNCPIDSPDDLWHGLIEYIIQRLEDPSRAIILG